MMRRNDPVKSSGGFIIETILQNIWIMAIDLTIQKGDVGKKVKVGHTAIIELIAKQTMIFIIASR